MTASLCCSAENAWQAPGEELLPEALESGVLSTEDLSQAEDYEASIVYNKGVPGIKVNGEVLPPFIQMAYAPGNPINDDVAMKMSQCGVDIDEIYTGIDRYFESRTPEYLENLEKSVLRLLAVNPKAKIILHFRFSDSKLWLAEHKDELISYADGPAEMDGDQVHRFYTASPASEPFRADVARTLNDLCEALKSKPWSKRIIGFRLSWGVYAEWHTYGFESGPDNSIPMTAAFRKHLQELYKTDEALQKAWHDDSVTLTTATVPGKEERAAQKGHLADPGSVERKLIDYRLFHQDVVADLLLLMADTMKKHFPKKLVGVYYGYAFESWVPSEGMNVNFDKVLKSGNVDFLSAPQMYLMRSRFVGGNGRGRNMTGICARYGKLAVMEADVRTHWVDPSDGSNSFYKGSDTPKQDGAMVLRSYMNALFDGLGVQLYHVHPGKAHHWHNEPEVFKAVHNAVKAWKLWYENPPVPNNEIAVVYDPQADIPNSRGMNASIFYGTTAALNYLDSTGYTYDLMTPEDFLITSQNYRVVIMLNCYAPSKEMAAKLKAKVQDNVGLYTLWCYAPGLVTPEGFSAEAMSELTGIKLDFRREQFQHKVMFNDKRVMQMDLGPRFGNMTEQYLRTYSVDKDAQVLGRFVDSGDAAFVKKQLENGSIAVFSAIPLLRSDILAELFREARVHQYTQPARQALRTNRDYIMLHRCDADCAVIQLPNKAKKVIDVFSGRVVGENTDTIYADCEEDKAHTWLFKLEGTGETIPTVTAPEGPSVPLAVTTDAYGSGFPEKLIRAAKTAGFSHIMWCENWSDDKMYTDEEMKEYAAFIHDLGLQVVDVHASDGSKSGCKRRWDSLDEEERKGGVELVINRIKFAAMLNPERPVIVLHAWNHDKYADVRKGVDVFRKHNAAIAEATIKSIRELIPVLEEYHAKIAIETLWFNDEILEKVFAEFPVKYVGLCFDTGHSNVCFKNSPIFKVDYDFVYRHKDRILSLHINDNFGDGYDFHRFPFTCGADWEYVSKIIAESAYQGPLSFEISTPAGDQVENLKDLHRRGVVLNRMVEERRQ